MIKSITPGIKTFLFCFVAILSFSLQSNAQTIRYQQSIRGGFAVAANCLVDAPAGTTGGVGVPINTAGGTTMSSYADLVLPVGSTIAKAYLYAEQFTPNANTITSVKFRVPGGAYTTLTTTSPGFIASRISSEYSQFIIDVTSLMPANGYVSAVTAGGEVTGAGRYAVADISVFDAGDKGAGWSLIVVYTNPSSKYRNVTIADNCATYAGTTCVGAGCYVTFNVNGISVPSSGTVAATVAYTGGFGDIGLNDQIQFGKMGGTLVNLTDPTTNSSTDMMNSTIGVCANNNVSIDATAAGSPITMSGNVTSRNPYKNFDNPNSATPPSWYSYFYDSDIVDATGVLAPSATPINVTFKQISPTVSGGDLLGGGAYAISVDIAAAIITKSISPSSIVQGTTATYSWLVDNSVTGGLNLTGIGFTDNLPASIKIATPTGLRSPAGVPGAL